MNYWSTFISIIYFTNRLYFLMSCWAVDPCNAHIEDYTECIDEIINRFFLVHRDSNAWRLNAPANSGRMFARQVLLKCPQNSTACLHLAFSLVSRNIQLIFIFHEFCACKSPIYQHLFVTSKLIIMTSCGNLWPYTVQQKPCSPEIYSFSRDKQCKAPSCLSSHIVNMCFFMVSFVSLFLTPYQ